MRFDLLVRGGEVIDPASGLRGRRDVAISDGRISAVDHAIPGDTAAQVIDAEGAIVVPGLVDLHAHLFRGAGYFGIDADSIASRSGVTTWADAGSAGAFHLPAFKEHIIEPALTRILAFINISYLGLSGLNYDEYCNIDACDVDLLERVATLNSDILVGIKCRMGTARVGNQGLEPLRRALSASERTGLRLMVHIANAPPEVESVLELLRPGDILTHSFTGLGMRLVNDDGSVKQAALRARDAGVILDVGHGSGSFSFESAESMTAAGVWPDVISTDLHQVSLPGPNLIDPLAQEVIARVRGDGEPQFTMLTVMSKFLYLGMPLADVVAAASHAPARVLGLDREIGRLDKGACADIAVLRLEPTEVDLFDIHGNRRRAGQVLRHAVTILDGRPLEPLPLPPPPPWIRLVDQEETS